MPGAPAEEATRSKYDDNCRVVTRVKNNPDAEEFVPMSVAAPDRDDEDPADDEEGMEGEGHEEDEGDSEDALVGNLASEDGGSFTPKETDDDEDAARSSGTTKRLKTE